MGKTGLEDPIGLKVPGKVGGSDAGFCPGGGRCSWNVETEVVSGLAGDESIVTNASDDLKEGITVKAIAAR